MKKAEVELPEALHQHIERLARERRVSIGQLLCQAAEQMVRSHPQSSPKSNDWQFPEGLRLGPFLANVEDWHLFSSEAEAV